MFYTIKHWFQSKLKLKNRWVWFFMLYIVSIIVIGSMMMLIHAVAALLLQLAP